MSQFQSFIFRQTAVKGIQVEKKKKKKTSERTEDALGLIFELQINIEIVLSVLGDNNRWKFFKYSDFFLYLIIN